jgi:hypothetical protein
MSQRGEVIAISISDNVVRGVGEHTDDTPTSITCSQRCRSLFTKAFWRRLCSRMKQKCIIWCNCCCCCDDEDSADLPGARANNYRVSSRGVCLFLANFFKNLLNLFTDLIVFFYFCNSVGL